MNTNFLSFIRNACFCGQDSIVIKSKKYYIKEKIGEGGFSTVYVAESSLDKRLYAIKKIVCHSVDDQSSALSEVQTHEKIKHENVVQLVDYELIGTPEAVTNTTSELYLVLPYYWRGTLHHELQERAALKRPLSEIQVLNMFLKICLGVKAFHDLKPPVAHRDLKTANILLEADDTPIIMDLGSAANARVTITNSSDAQKLQDLAAERCSMPYKAPELFNVEKYSVIDERTDIWSLGCILFALCFYKSPYDIIYEKGDSVALAVLNGKITFPDGHMYGKSMEDLIMFLLNGNPQERPFIDDVIAKTENTLKYYSAMA